MRKIIWDLALYSNRDALIDEYGNRLKYSALKDECDKLGTVIGSRCLIFCLSTNTIGSILGYVSFLNSGMVTMLLNNELDHELLNRLIELYHPQFIWLPLDNKNVSGDIIYEAYGYALVKFSNLVQFRLNDNLALLLSTSGSTGSPKFVRQSYKNISSNTKAIIEYLELNDNERPITTLPMHYTYGLSVINTHLAVGATILVTEKTMAQKEFWDFFKGQSATSIAGVPYTYEMLNRMRFFRMELPSLRTMTQAGGKLSPELHEKVASYANERGKRFIVMYGQCEATARMGYLPAKKAIEKKGSMGIAIPGGKFRLVDEYGENVSDIHTIGELVYEGDNVTMGYAEKGEDLCLGDERLGILVTGDMAEFDNDGYYYIVGRKKRFLKIYGNRVNLDEMDRLLSNKYGADVICGGYDDHMFIFMESSVDAEKVRNYAIKITKLNPIAFKVIQVEKIPRNDAGKVLYKELEKYYGM